MKEEKGDYPLIPMKDIDDEARELAVTWFESDVKEMNWIGDKHKLASDIMNYAKKRNKELNEQCEIFLKFNENNPNDDQALIDSARLLLKNLKRIIGNNEDR